MMTDHNNTEMNYSTDDVRHSFFVSSKCTRYLSSLSLSLYFSLSSSALSLPSALSTLPSHPYLLSFPLPSLFSPLLLTPSCHSWPPLAPPCTSPASSPPFIPLPHLFLSFLSFYPLLSLLLPSSSLSPLFSPLLSPDISSNMLAASSSKV